MLNLKSLNPQTQRTEQRLSQFEAVVWWAEMLTFYYQINKAWVLVHTVTTVHSTPLQIASYP